MRRSRARPAARGQRNRRPYGCRHARILNADPWRAHRLLFRGLVRRRGKTHRNALRGDGEEPRQARRRRRRALGAIVTHIHRRHGEISELDEDYVFSPSKCAASGRTPSSQSSRTWACIYMFLGVVLLQECDQPGATPGDVASAAWRRKDNYPGTLLEQSREGDPPFGHRFPNPIRTSSEELAPQPYSAFPPWQSFLSGAAHMPIPLSLLERLPRRIVCFHTYHSTLPSPGFAESCRLTIAGAHLYWLLVPAHLAPPCIGGWKYGQLACDKSVCLDGGSCFSAPGRPSSTRRCWHGPAPAMHGSAAEMQRKTQKADRIAPTCRTCAAATLGMFCRVWRISAECGLPVPKFEPRSAEHDQI